LLLAVVILIAAAGFCTPLVALAANTGETREATYSKDEKDKKDTIRFTFPVSGGPISGIHQWETGEESPGIS
jgi:hypothetical protein